MTLPRTVDAERIEAHYEHGVLHLELPKRRESQPRRIAISTAPAARPVQGPVQGPDATDQSPTAPARQEPREQIASGESAS